MSRTVRNKRKPRRWRSDSYGGKLRDGAPQFLSYGCEHRGFCSWCEGNRTHANARRALLFTDVEVGKPVAFRAVLG